MPFNAQRLSYEAVGAVGTDYVASADALLFLAQGKLAVFTNHPVEHHVAAIRVLLERSGFPALMDLHVADAFGFAVEDGLQ
ncbi:hypothetical protein D3C76_1641890 [compost metagenome]